MEAVALADVLKFSEEELTLLTNTDSLEKAFEKVTALYPEKLIIVDARQRWCALSLRK